MLASSALWFLLCQAVVRAMPSQGALPDDLEDPRGEGEPLKGGEELAFRSGAALFGSPDYKTGDAVANWNPLSLVNPEELGSYPGGDIIFPRKDAINYRNGMKNLSRRWPNGVVPFIIDSSFKDKELAVISIAMDHFHKLSCIRFVPRTNEKDYVNITNNYSGKYSECNSDYVGRQGGAQGVNLQSDRCLNDIGTPIHELLHALGFYHEHSRSDRGQYVKINLNNAANGTKHNFNKEDTDGMGVEYDYYSVMHYSAFAFSENGQPTIEPLKPGVHIGQRRGFSKKDLQKLNKMYECD